MICISRSKWLFYLSIKGQKESRRKRYEACDDDGAAGGI